MRSGGRFQREFQCGLLYGWQRTGQRSSEINDLSFLLSAVFGLFARGESNASHQEKNKQDDED
jgi:hypothetical protein